MNKLFKTTNLLVLALLFTAFSCSNDDSGAAANTQINVENLTATIDENPTYGQVVGTVTTDGSGTLSFSITSQTPTGALSVNSSSGELTVANAAAFDFETNPIITATVTVVGALSPATVTINLNNLNEASIQDLTVDIDENPTDGQVVSTVPSGGSGASNFNITAQTPAGALSIDASTGELTVADATLFDYETNPIITATIAVDDAMNAATATINLTNIYELSAQDLTMDLDENPTDGQVVGAIQATGVGTLSFSITSQTPAGALNIDATTGELTVVDPNLFDFETNPVITATIAVDDAENPATVTINLNDIDEINVQDFTSAIDENPINGQVIGTIQATSAGSLSYEITYQSTSGALSIDQSTGELSVADYTLFDFETTPTMFATISVDNGVYSVSATANINLENIDEIGDFNYGGVIFYLDGNGGGLVCDVVDLVNPASNSIQWSIGTNAITGATGMNIGTGQANTTAIINSHGAGVYAATLCDNLSTGGFSDWYLPSLFELLEIFMNREVVSISSEANGGDAIVNFYFWSSTEVNVDQARFMDNIGSSGAASKNNYGAYVRAVRTFTN
ncbi:hypothetical protein [Aurantibacter sp.]|uniref:hypothetical protein n=1 Tax=Aurantibacter sp. TaxID=2807103 RepID=UPI003263856E